MSITLCINFSGFFITYTKSLYKKNLLTGGSQRNTILIYGCFYEQQRSCDQYRDT